MSDAAFVAGDWGTSHLRLFLCDDVGHILERAAGPGAADAGGRFATVLTSLLAPWQHRHGPLPAVLCGMVGSSIGWLQAPYVRCPARPDQIASGCVSPREGVQVVPGLSCRNRFNAPDFMRGEETQILGALSIDPALRRGRRLLCLPGTHTKWALLADGVVDEFLTAPTGELFALLLDHSVLLRGNAAGDAADAVAAHAAAPDAAAVDAAAFRQGVAQFGEYPQAQLLHRLFECRARRLDGELGAQASAAFLSGLLVASDISGALRLLAGKIDERSVHLIGSPQLTQRYAIGLAVLDCAATSIDGEAAALAGLVLLHRQLSLRRRALRQVADAGG
jgi:2-dehydro-3-deoxygalactonokinase